MPTTLICRTCGDMYDLPDHLEHAPCRSCGTENCRPQADADTCEILVRATKQRLRCDFIHAESSYQYVLRESPEEHEALWGLVQCRYGVEYVDDPHTGKRMPIVHAVRKRPMLTDPDFREACELAPEAVRAQYRQEAEYIDGAMAKIRQLAEKGEQYDVFLCHKTSRTDGVEGYTEDFKRATELYIMLKEMGHNPFFAPFAGLTPGENYEAGIYHALCTAKVMLVLCSTVDYITSPWVRTEWQRFLEMSYEPGADKHLIPLLYDGMPPRRLPDDFRQLQAVAMGELNARDNLIAAVKGYCGEKRVVVEAKKVEPPKAVVTEPEPPKFEPPKPIPPKPVPLPSPKPQPVIVPKNDLVHAGDFTVRPTKDGCVLVGYTGKEAHLVIPEKLGGVPVRQIGERAFKECDFLETIRIPAGVTVIQKEAYEKCTRLATVELPDTLQEIGFGCFNHCTQLQTISLPESLTKLGHVAFEACQALTEIRIPGKIKQLWNFTFTDCKNLRYVQLPAGLEHIGCNVFHGCTALEDIQIPEGVVSIGASAFENCAKIKKIVIPDGVTIINKETFYGCRELREICLSRNLTEIKDGAFAWCVRLQKILLPQSLRTIGDSAFLNCKNLYEIPVPASVTRIGSNAFTGCDALPFLFRMKMRWMN